MSRRVPLAPAKQRSCRGILMGMKRCAVNRMNDRGNVQRRRRQSGQEASLRAVRMNYVGAELTNGLLEREIAGTVALRIDCPPQTWHEPDRHSPSPAVPQQIAFRTERRPRDQQHFV